MWGLFYNQLGQAGSIGLSNGGCLSIVFQVQIY